MKSRVAALYTRVSTLVHGQDVENQRVPIAEFAQARNFDLKLEYSDEGISGAKANRPGLDQLVADAKKGKFKYLIVMEISRLARDVRHLLNLLHELDSYGVSVISIREGIEFNSVMGRAMVVMIGVLVSVERELLRERIKSALATKKANAEKTGNGWRCGRPPKITEEVIRRISALRASGASLREIARIIGISKSSVQNALSMSKKPDLTENEPEV